MSVIEAYKVPVSVLLIINLESVLPVTVKYPTTFVYVPDEYTLGLTLVFSPINNDPEVIVPLNVNL